jgi:8-amino-7-oxononanoate synthase
LKLEVFLLCDEFSHNSILLGAQGHKYKFARFEHNNLTSLVELAKQKKTGNSIVWAVTESVFSMGNLAPIEKLLSISQNSNIHLYIDEAHATGVFGNNGMGLVSNPDDKVLVMGTFGKGCGSFGAYIACSKACKDFLTNFCSGIIYTTALPPAVLGAVQAALELIPHLVTQRKCLLNNASMLRQELAGLGFSISPDPSQIIFLRTNDEQKALSLSRYLRENKIYAPAIRPPTVPVNASGLRFSLSAAHEQNDIEYLIGVLRQYRGNS